MPRWCWIGRGLPCRWARGRWPPREQVVRLGSCSPKWGALPPQPPERGRSAPPPRVTFPSRGKSPKARQGLRPLESPRCEVAALFALAYASRRATSCHNKRPICHFERVGKSVLFFPLVSSRKHFLFAIRGTAGALPPRMPWAFLPATNTARAPGRGIKGGYAPFAGGPGTRRSLVSLW